MSSFLILEPGNEGRASNHLFHMSRMVWGPCKDCVMKNNSKSNFDPRSNRFKSTKKIRNAKRK